MVKEHWKKSRVHARLSRMNEEQIGLLFMILTSFCFVVMSALVSWGARREPVGSAFLASFVRTIVNLAVVVAYASWLKERHTLFGNLSLPLWLRGIFGSMGLITYFYSIENLGVAESSFLASTSGVWVALLGPWVLKKRNPLSAYIAIFGAMLGIFLLLSSNFTSWNWQGRVAGVLSGFFGSCAYLTISKSGKAFRPNTIVFYFCFVSLIFHLVGFAFFRFSFPTQWQTYLLFAGSGIAAALAQLCLTRGYQTAPAASAAAVSYLTTFLNCLSGVLFFDERLTGAGFLGGALIIVCGVFIPFLSASRRPPPAVEAS